MFLSNSTKTVENSFYLTLAWEELPYLLILKILSFLTKKKFTQNSIFHLDSLKTNNEHRFEEKCEKLFSNQK